MITSAEKIKETDMPLTRNVRELFKERAERDPKFCDGLFCEAVDAWFSGEVEISKVLFRDYVDASIGLEVLAEKMKKTPENLMRMLNGKGNPRASSLHDMIVCLKEHKDVPFMLAHNDDLYE